MPAFLVCVNNRTLRVHPYELRGRGPSSFASPSLGQELAYQADTWTCLRRVVAEVEDHADELFPRVGFIVTKADTPESIVVSKTSAEAPSVGSKRQAGNALDAAVLSPVPRQGPAFAAERARLQPGNLWRRLVSPVTGRHVVAHQSAAAPHQHRRQPGEAGALLLAAPGGGPSDPRLFGPCSIASGRCRCRRNDH